MSATPSVSPDDVAARLRQAGCVFAEDEARLLVEAARTPEELDTLVARRVDGLPLEHLLGWAEFCGLRIEVDPGVFVPRRRTEVLVHEALPLAGPGSVVVDLCCGTGAVGAAIADATKGVQLYAVDVDPAALACAHRNVEAAGGVVLEGDLYAPLPSMLHGRVDVLVANAPYVPTDEIGMMPPEARLHEARVALDGGADGLDIARRMVAGALDWLAPGGHLLIETSERQAPRLAEAFSRHGLVPGVAHSDEQGGTVVVGSRATSREVRG